MTRLLRTRLGGRLFALIALESILILGVVLNRVHEVDAMHGDYYYRYYGSTRKKRFSFFRRS